MIDAAFGWTFIALLGWLVAWLVMMDVKDEEEHLERLAETRRLNGKVNWKRDGF